MQFQFLNQVPVPGVGPSMPTHGLIGRPGAVQPSQAHAGYLLPVGNMDLRAVGASSSFANANLQQDGERGNVHSTALPSRPPLYTSPAPASPATSSVAGLLNSSTVNGQEDYEDDSDAAVHYLQSSRRGPYSEVQDDSEPEPVHHLTQISPASMPAQHGQGWYQQGQGQGARSSSGLQADGRMTGHSNASTPSTGLSTSLGAGTQQRDFDRWLVQGGNWSTQTAQAPAASSLYSAPATNGGMGIGMIDGQVRYSLCKLRSHLETLD